MQHVIAKYDHDSNTTVVIFEGKTYIGKVELEVFHGSFMEALEKETITHEFLQTIFPLTSNPKEVDATKLAMQKGKTIKESNLFTWDGDVFYRHGIKLSVPDVLLSEYTKALLNDDFEEIDRLDMFWYRCALCPVEHARQDLFTFLKDSGLEVLPNGVFLAVRKVIDRSNDLREFLADAIHLVKVKWKQKLSNIEVYYVEGQFELFDTQNKNKPKGDFVNNLLTLYNNAENYQFFTDRWTKKMAIQIGTAVKLDRKDCDSRRNVTCSKGLHFANLEFYDVACGYGDTFILVAIDPRNLVSVPISYDGLKGRCCEYMPLAVVQEVDGELVYNREEILELASQYGVQSINELFIEASKIEKDFETNFVYLPSTKYSYADLVNESAVMDRMLGAVEEQKANVVVLENEIFSDDWDDDEGDFWEEEDEWEWDSDELDDEEDN